MGPRSGDLEPNPVWSKVVDGGGERRADQVDQATSVSVGRRPLGIVRRDLTERHRIIEHGGETEYIRQMLSRLAPDDVLWDVGVCVGAVALHAACTCQVVGFEPDPDVRERFELNLALNPGLAVDLQPYAISDTDGTATLHLGERTSSSLRRQRGETRTAEVPVRTIDTLVGQLPTPTVVKLDIEGAELPALHGASDLLASGQRPRLLFLEVHPEFLPAFGGTGGDVLDIVEDAGYVPTWVAPRAGQLHMVLEAA